MSRAGWELRAGAPPHSIPQEPSLSDVVIQAQSCFVLVSPVLTSHVIAAASPSESTSGPREELSSVPDYFLQQLVLAA